MSSTDPYRFAPGLDRFDEALGEAAWGLEDPGPPLSDLRRAAEATGDELLVEAVAFLEELDLEGLAARGLVRRPRTYRDIFRWPEALSFPKVEDPEAQRRIRFTGPEVAPEGLALYVDIPFCTRRCLYCGTAGVQARADRGRPESYLAALEAEARLLAARFDGGLPPPTCLYVGGGTGSYLTVEETGRLLDFLGEVLGLPADAPKTMEGSPDSVDGDKVEGLRALGFDGISLGVECFDDEVLRLCNRSHDVADAERVVRECRDAGMAHTNLDLIAGMVGQSLPTFLRSLQTTGALRPGAVTVYSLRVHEHTGWWKAQEARFPTVGVVYLMQAAARLYLARLGYHRSEGNRWVLDTALRHAQHTHTRSGWYDVGLGTRAGSHVAGLAWSNVRDLRAYEEAVGAGRLPVARLADIDARLLMEKCFVLPLKLDTGLSDEAFRSRFGVDHGRFFGEPARRLADWGLLRRRADGGWVATEAGALLETEGLRWLLAQRREAGA